MSAVFGNLAHSPEPRIRLKAEASLPLPDASLKLRCATCLQKDMCFACRIAVNDARELHAFRFGQRRVRSGQTLYQEGDYFQFLYMVRNGTFKSRLLLPDGREQVNGFCMAGDILGLDGVAGGCHASTAIALEDADVCVISYSRLTELAAGNAGLLQLLARMMSREILREHRLITLLGSMNAQERVTDFLLNLSHKLKTRGYSAVEFHLRMSRAEIGSYLGMTLETVSRTFSSFQQLHLLEVDKRHIRLLDIDGLKRALKTSLH
jgi:CRP/FNR family transcriptional regulator